MTFAEAIKSCYQKYATLSGRAGRSEFWYFNLLFYGPMFLIGIVAAVMASEESVPLMSGLWAVFALANLLPLVAVSVRRLHDVNMSGWWLLVRIIPILGDLYLLIKFCTKGDVGSNRYGEQPKLSSVKLNDDLTQQAPNRGVFARGFFLECTHGQYKGARFPLPTSCGAIAIGTDPSRCQIVIDKKSHPAISPQHCLVTYSGVRHDFYMHFSADCHTLSAVGASIKTRMVPGGVESYLHDKPSDWSVINTGAGTELFSDSRFETEIDMGSGLFFKYCFPCGA